MNGEKFEMNEWMEGWKNFFQKDGILFDEVVFNEILIDEWFTKFSFFDEKDESFLQHLLISIKERGERL